MVPACISPAFLGPGMKRNLSKVSDTYNYCRAQGDAEVNVIPDSQCHVAEYDPYSERSRRYVLQV